MAKEILLVGAGKMAIEYTKVLQELNINPIVIGRGESSAIDFFNETGIKVIRTGIEEWLSEFDSAPKTAIICASEKNLGNLTSILLDKNVKKILVEKPGCFESKELVEIKEKALKKDAKVFVGYNRRFYSSVSKLIELIKIDGGVKSFNFEFTEWGHIIRAIKKEEGVKERWFLHNSTHVIDLAFFIGGFPKVMNSYVSGGVDWHPSASIFAGAGISDTGALFSYQANWGAPGRWSIEVLTNSHKFILRPLEKLQVQNIGSISTEFVLLEDEIDIKFKAGIFSQVKAFFEDDYRLLTISDQCRNVTFYEKICNPFKYK